MKSRFRPSTHCKYPTLSGLYDKIKKDDMNSVNTSVYNYKMVESYAPLKNYYTVCMVTLYLFSESHRDKKVLFLWREGILKSVLSLFMNTCHDPACVGLSWQVYRWIMSQTSYTSTPSACTCTRAGSNLEQNYEVVVNYWLI